MSEKEKIEKMLEDNKALFEATDMDVTESIKGNWFFTRYNAEFDYFDAVARFQTAQELAEILLGEISLDIYSSVEGSVEKMKYKNLADDIVEADFYKPYVEELLKHHS